MVIILCTLSIYFSEHSENSGDKGSKIIVYFNCFKAYKIFNSSLTEKCMATEAHSQRNQLLLVLSRNLLDRRFSITRNFSNGGQLVFDFSSHMENYRIPSKLIKNLILLVYVTSFFLKIIYSYRTDMEIYCTKGKSRMYEN